MLGVLRRVFSFTSWQQGHPNEPPPGDMLDASFDAQNSKIDEIEAVVSDIRRSDGGLQNGVVGIDQLHPDLKAALRIPTAKSSNGDELGWKTAEAEADVWAHASKDWAEHMPDTIPDGSVAVMDITGDHWSSRWWAHQAAVTVSSKFGGIVIDAAAPPDPHEGLCWWSNVTGNLHIWYIDQDSAQWVQINTASSATGGGAFVIPQQFGAVGDGVADDTAAIHAAFATGLAVYFPEATYKVGQLVIPANSVIRASKLAVIRSDGTTTGAQLVLDIGNNVDFDTLAVSIPGGSTASGIIRIGDNVRGGTLRLAADTQATTGGAAITTLGNSVVIDRIECIRVDRPLYLGNSTPTTVTAIGTRIGFLYVESYIRGLRIDNVSATIGGVRLSGLSPNAVAMTAGQNGILIQGAPDLNIGDVWIEDSSEHSIRISGPTITGYQWGNIKFGNITTINSTGCTFKVNPGTASPLGYVENVQVGNILAVDTGGTGGNQEILRLSHCRNVSIGNVLSVAQNKAASGQYGLIANNARNVTIASLGGTFFNTFITIDSASDTSSPADAGDIIGLRIGRLHGTTTPGTVNTAIGVGGTTYPINIADVHIHCDGISGFDTSLLRWDANATVTGVVRLTGWVADNVPPTFETVPLDSRVQADITHQGRRFVGRAADLTMTALSVAPPVFTNSSTPAGGLSIINSAATSGSGLYGGAIEFTRLASNRRGAAIVAKQTSADQKEMGMEFFVCDVSTTGNETLQLAMGLNAYARVTYNSTVAKYADNAAAIAGGLAVGTLYWTATGEARIVV